MNLVFDVILVCCCVFTEKVDSWHLKINDENTNLMTAAVKNQSPSKQKMYLRKAISTLLSHKDIKRSSHTELRVACEEALKVLDEQFPINGGSTPAASPSSASILSSSVLPEPNPILVHVEKFFLPFELACHSKTPKIVCSALDSIEKLVAYGHISYEYFEVKPAESYKKTVQLDILL